MGQLVELRTGERCIEVLRAGRIRGDEREVDVSAHHAGKLDLGFFGSLLQALHGHFIAAQINAGFLLEGIRDPVYDLVIEIVAAESGIARRGKDFENAVAYFEYGNIEGAAAEVVNHDLLVEVFIQTVCERGCRRFVDNTQNIQPRDLAGILCRLTLCIREVCRNGDDRLGYGGPEVGFRIGFQLLKYHCADRLRGVALSVHVHLIIGAHFALDGYYRSVRIGDSLSFCDGADHYFAVFGKCHDGRCGSVALRIGDDCGLAAFVDRHTRVCSTEVNAYDFCHNNSTCLYIKIFLFFALLCRAIQFTTFTIAWRITFSPSL